MSDLSITVGEFLEELSESGPLWNSVDLRVVAIRFFGRWCNLVTSCVLDARPTMELPQLSSIVETSNILALQTVFSIAELGTLFERLMSGEIEVEGRAISYRTGEARQERQSEIFEGEPYRWGNVGYWDRSSPYAQADLAWSALTFSVNGDTLQTYLRHLPRDFRGLDQEIRTFSRPYDGLGGLVKHFARGSDRFDGSHSSRFEVIAPFQVRFARELSGFEEELRVGIRVGSSIAQNSCHLGYFAVDTQGVPIAGTLNLSDAVRIENAPDATVVVTHAAPKAGSITLFLSVGPHCVDKITLTRLPAHGPNPRVEAFRTVDPDLDYFRSGFNPGIRPITNAFEQSVGRLFTFLGFTVDVLGPDKKISDGVDLFAYTQTMAFAIECTTGSIDAGGKLGKLVLRSRAVAAAVDREVFAILATSLERERIADHELSQAAEAGVVVLAREELDHLFEMCLANAPLASAAEYIAAQKVPKGPRESPVRMVRRS